MNPLKTKWEKNEEEHETMLRGRLSALSRTRPHYISPRTKARLAEKRRLLKAQTNAQALTTMGKDQAQFSRKPRPKSHRRATMRVPMNAGFWRTLKWIFTGK